MWISHLFPQMSLWLSLEQVPPCPVTVAMQMVSPVALSKTFGKVLNVFDNFDLKIFWKFSQTIQVSVAVTGVK